LFLDEYQLTEKIYMIDLSVIKLCLCEASLFSAFP